MNKRVTIKERGLIKGALRRVFSRSELRKQALEDSYIDCVKADPKRERPRVTRWSRCPNCLTATPAYLMQIDHINPIVKVTEVSAELDANTLVDRIWCDPKNLVAICKVCHNKKTKEENRIRRQYKKENKNNGPQRS